MSLNGWKNTRLKPLTTKIGSGVTPKGGSAVYTESGIPFIRSQNVHRFILRGDDLVFITPEQHEKMSPTKTRPNDVLLNITGASIGRSCVIPIDFPESNLNQHVCIIRCKNELNPQFLCSFLNSFLGQRQIFSYQAGGNREGLNFEQIGKFKIPLPPLPEQKKIAEILSCWDSAIETIQKLIDAKTRFKKGLMQRLIPWAQNLPESDTVPLGKLCSITTGKKDANEGNPNGQYRFYTCAKEYSFSDVYSFDTEAILISGNGAGVGYTHYFNGKFEAYQRTYVLSNFSKIDVRYLLHAVRKHLKREIDSQKQDTATPYIKLGLLKKLRLPRTTQRQELLIAQILDTVDSELEQLIDMMSLLQQQKKALMQQLLTGKIRVKTDSQTETTNQKEQYASNA